MAGTNTETLEGFLHENQWDAPDLSAIEDAFHQLQIHLHDETLRSQQNAANMPVLRAEKAGTFRMGIPARNEPLKVVVFGTISSTIYHDLIWERVQKILEYKSARAGIYEVQKLPELHFVIHFRGFDFDWTYLQAAQLLRSYNEDFLQASQEDVDDWCSDEVAYLIEQLQKESEVLERLGSTRQRYYAARAWAVLYGVNDEPLEFAIAEDLAHALSPVSAPLDKLLVETKKSNLAEFDDEEWLQVLRVTVGKTFPEIFPADHYLVVKIMHSGSSNTQATTWLRYIESRLLILAENLTTKLRYFQQEVLGQDDKHRSKSSPVAKVYNGRLVHEAAVSESSAYYEGCYIFGLHGLGNNLQAFSDYAQLTVERSFDFIQSRQPTMQGKCFLSHEFLSSQDIALLESQNGKLVLCRRPEARVFIPSPILALDDQADITIPASVETETPYTETQTPGTSKLRTASDIHNRLLHDAAYNIDEFIIGYIDRFSPEPLEMRAANWDRVKEHEAFIPESRIRYFKRRWSVGGEQKEEVVWDRGRRIDKVFWSGNSAAGVR